MQKILKDNQTTSVVIAFIHIGKNECPVMGINMKHFSFKKKQGSEQSKYELYKREKVKS